VNEFVKEEFLRAVIEEKRKLSVASGTGKGNSGKMSDKIGQYTKTSTNARVVLEENDAVVLDLPTRGPELLEVKTEAPVLAIHAVKSLDDAIDFIGTAQAGPALAAYHFGNPQVGKYLAQFVDARVSFVNHVPRDLLIGPARPATHLLDYSAAYTIDMLSFPRPAYIRPSTLSIEMAGIMSSANSSTASVLLEKAWSPLKAMKRKPGGGVGMLNCLR
jgi:hypothetical protein